MLQDDAASAMLMGQPGDSLSVEDDELDRHDCMLPLIHLVEKAAALFQVHSYPWDPPPSPHPLPYPPRTSLVTALCLVHPHAYHDK